MIWKFVVPALLCGAVGCLTPVAAQDAVITTAQTGAVKEDFPQGILFPYTILDRALDGRVDKNGNVDYVALQGNKDLERFLLAVATADLSQFPVFPVPPTPEALKKDREARGSEDRSAEMVFWINAYNAHMLKAIADAYPVSSPDQIKDLDTAKTRRVAGENYSFAEMREKISKFDGRALFALTDGTHGGPLLNPTAYRWADINALLEHAVRSYVNDNNNVQVTRIENKVEVSDFLLKADPYFIDAQSAGGANRGKNRGVRFLLAAYMDERAERSFVNTNDYRLVTRPADRSLNKKKLD